MAATVHNDLLSHCETLLNETGFVIDDHWYSQSCIMHEYSKRDMDACLHSVAAQNVSMAALSTLLHSHLKNQNVLINPLSQRMVLLNVLCNKVLLPVDATCCLPRDSRSPAVVLSILILLICGCLFALVYLVSLKMLQKLGRAFPEVREITPPWATEVGTMVWTLCRVIFILTCVYLADRSPLFGVMPKAGCSSWFTPLLLIVLALTLPAWKSSREGSTVMSRSQTDETKGWMQCVILIYHYTGTSKVLSVYLFVRVLVAAYLFLSGYGHFRFYWKTGHFRIKRFILVMLRLNFSTVLVAMVMGAPYEQYYFVPLISFWFVFVCLFMFSWPRVTGSSMEDSHRPGKLALCFLLKFVVFFFVIEIMVSNQKLFEALFSHWPLHWVFADSSGSLREWWFRVQLDRHAVLWGMFVAFVLSLCEDCSYDILRGRKWPKMVLPVVSGTVLICYGLFLWNCKSKVECNLFHTRWSFLPIIAFFVLRNITDTARRVRNYTLEFIGIIALELFLCQFHVWLAFDTRGLLLVYKYSHVLNFFIVTPVFVFVSISLHYSTKDFVTVITGS